jgi:hypothetical protein
LDYLAENSVSRGCFGDMPERLDYIYTLEDEEILVIGGVKLLNTHTGIVWMDLTQHGLDNLVKSYRVIREWLEEMIRNLELKRTMAFIECDFLEAIRTVEHLGFKKESEMHKFFNEKTALCYVRFD